MEQILIREYPACRRRLAWVVFCLVPGLVLAAPVSWVGPNDSFWDLPANWNPGLPGLADDALLGAFNTEFRQNTVGIRSFTGTGTLKVSGGQLSVTNASSTGSLNMTGGSLGGAGNLTITGSTTSARATPGPMRCSSIPALSSSRAAAPGT